MWYFIDPAIRFIEELVAFHAFNRDKDGALSILIVLHWFLTNPRLWLFVVFSAVHIFIISCTKIPKLIAKAVRPTVAIGPPTKMIRVHVIDDAVAVAAQSVQETAAEAEAEAEVEAAVEEEEGKAASGAAAAAAGARTAEAEW